jgi:hypothetical protein
MMWLLLFIKSAKACSIDDYNLCFEACCFASRNPFIAVFTRLKLENDERFAMA